MTEFFLKIVNMSISASWLVLAVLFLRLVLKKAPKWANVLLWGIVAVRLLCPFSIESALSLIPSAETISPEIMMDATPSIQTIIPAINSAVNPVISQTVTPTPGASLNPLQIWIVVFAVIWAIGIVALLVYTAINYWHLRRRVCTAVILRDNIFQSENVSTPFVLGIIGPKIYLPFKIDGRDLEHVVAHEQAHIRRRDHWWKPLGFLLLTLHWFNPLMWLAYVLLCRDIELACDEEVIKELGNEQRADYTQALLACSVNRRMIAACPLAFGEVGVKKRVKSVMNYKKPAFWIIVVAVVACVVVAVCFLTDPPTNRESQMKGNNVSESGDKGDKQNTYSSDATEIPYTIRISRTDIPIFEGPGYDYTYVGTIQAAGTYTIVEEKLDYEGILWGKLKSGVGWIDIAETKSEKTNHKPITVGFADEQLLSSGDYHEFIADDSEYMVKLAFRSGEVLKNVCFSSLQYEGGTYGIIEELYTLPELSPDMPLVTGVVYYGDTTTYGISFTDGSGEERYFAAYISARNGALTLEEYHP